MIPKTLHQIWIGPHPPPSKWMDTWKAKNPDMEYRLWTEADVPDLQRRDRIEYQLEQGRYAIASDIMRIAILEQHGGVYVDADSVCLEPIQDAYFMEFDFFVGWDYPDRRGMHPWRVANGTIGSVAHHRLLVNYLAWLGVAPMQKSWRLGGKALTTLLAGYRVSILPTCTFYPTNWDGRIAPVEGTIYAEQYWATTKGGYV